MTLYHGGKKYNGLKLAETIHKYTQTAVEDGFKVKGYCEPFCGMLGVYRHVPTLLGNIQFRAGDINKAVVLMWKAAQKGTKFPTSCTKTTFEKLKTVHKRSPSALGGFIGHQYSFGGQFFRGFSRLYGKSPKQAFAADNVAEIAQHLKKVKFTHGDYTEFSDLKGYVIYCDPPYYGRYVDYYNG